ncbi:hypothetical protein PoB_006137200 [Plakobranchus ocellatus]|uniref:Uncharacterized protein n=1 Tax=Plakobranchus ocellatus TaxID=259542 RepID=A0AAV4CSJ4_9GAST|nr:hypothetical protein PoB_006137200 [Plakobranchus ocellatus]
MWFRHLPPLAPNQPARKVPNQSRSGLKTKDKPSKTWIKGRKKTLSANNIPGSLPVFKAPSPLYRLRCFKRVDAVKEFSSLQSPAHYVHSKHYKCRAVLKQNLTYASNCKPTNSSITNVELG